RLRQAADEARRRAAFVAEASAVLSSSLNYDITLDRLAKLFVPFLGDWCAVTMEEGSSSRRVAIVHSDPAKVRLARKMQERYPGKITPEVLETGKPQLYQEITDELLRSFAYDEEHLRLLEQLDLQSALIVPLRTRGRAIGTITVATAESRRMLSEKELSLVEEIADRAALAVDNARLFREAQRAQAELQAANEAKDEFLGLISHELRSPITVIYGGARMLSARADKLDRESKLSIVNDIEQESERLYRVVEDLLALAKAELGHSAGLGAVSIEGIVNKVVGSFKQRRPHREIQIHALRGLPPVKGEEVYVEQVLRNLLSNSDKYSPPESPIEINARVGDEGNAVLVSVLDRGHGITEEEIDKIFERFYRAKSTSRQAKGIGIGLTVCRRLIETLGGSIWAEPRDGGGLIVSFSLPVLRE
ncbi:MAG TPA: ATP-binding protein, partial [Dehalococcoidia bacterium]|nr:ATP-binding protein [Dehalococcoidia bacterium]